MTDNPPARNPLIMTVPLYIQIAEGLLDRIESGELSPGDRLPPERELSEMLSVNRMTVRRALRMLEGQGLLVRRRGDGTYVSKPKIERQAGQVFPDRPALAVHRQDVQSVAIPKIKAGQRLAHPL